MKISTGLFGLNFLYFLYFGVSQPPWAAWAHVESVFLSSRVSSVSSVTFPVGMEIIQTVRPAKAGAAVITIQSCSQLKTRLGSDLEV